MPLELVTIHPASLKGLVLIPLTLCLSAGCDDRAGATQIAPYEDAGSADASYVDASSNDGGSPFFEFVRCENPGDPLPPLFEDTRVYDQLSPDVLTVHVTIDDLDGFADVNDDDDAHAPRDRVDVIFKAEGFGESAVAPNAILKARGHSSIRNEQKNYKINLNSDAGLWRGQRKINLNKHMRDRSRVRNKTAFDLMQGVPHLASIKTEFVRMFINGEDYGLYTMIEELDKRYLKAHGLDPEGQLYKGAHYRFKPIAPEVIANPDPVDDYYNSMDYFLEDKANPDLPKLLRMVDAINDESISVDELVSTYFNRDNLATWLAVNVLLNNLDTTTQNYYLYSPSSCEGWYMLPWDYDGAFGKRSPEDRDRWQSGLSNWWTNRLFKRFLTVEANVDAVYDRMVELQSTVMNDETLAARLASYHDIVEAYISTSPDSDHLPSHSSSGTPAEAIAVWQGELDHLATTISRYFAEYLAVIDRPMPVHLSFRDETPLKFRWDESFDLQGDPLTYDFEVSTSPSFGAGDLVAQKLGLIENQTTLPSLASGTYYWRVIIHGGDGPDSWQLPFDPYDEIVID